MESPMFSEYPDVITVEQLMEILHIGKNAAYSLLKSGEIRTIRIGRRYIIPKQRQPDRAFIRISMNEDSTGRF